MSSIKEYRVRCTTDNKYEYWLRHDYDPAPTTCPTNTSHTIDPAATTVVNTYDKNVVEIKEETTPTGGYFMCKTETIDAAASTTTTKVTSWKIPVSVLAVSFVTSSKHEGDSFTMTVAPDYPIGDIAADVAALSNTIIVSKETYDSIPVGNHIKLSDGVNTDNLGVVLSKDPDFLTLTTENQTTNSFLQATPTQILSTHYITEQYEIGPAWRYSIGENKIGGSYVQANAPIVIQYTNNSASSKKLVAEIEYLR